jgi:CheY-specific phosphatase CheX
MKAFEFASLVPECCAEVLEAMYFTTLLDSTLAEQPVGVSPDPLASIAFQLRFAGDVSGRFGMCLDQATAFSLAANFLGESDNTISADEVAEVVGELANMLCGSVMSRVEGEHKFALSHPERSSSPRLPGADGTFVSRLDTDCGSIAIWIVVEEDACPR